MLAYLIIVVPTGCPVVGVGVLLPVLLLVAPVLLAMPVAPVAVLACCCGGCGRGGGVAGAVVVGVVGVGVEVARVRGRRQAQGSCNVVEV